MTKALYVHIPFCKEICGYCDFSRCKYQLKLSNTYLDALEKQFSQIKANQFETIYIGGGTPTSLNLLQLERLFKMIEPYSKNVIEYTIEINPDTLTDEMALLLSNYRINRASIGLQSTSDLLLKEIGRTHTFKHVKKCIDILNNVGIDNISVDLMYGLPNQKLEDVIKSIEDVALLNIQHVSIYSLTIEENSRFNKEGIKQVSSDLETQMYLASIYHLEKNGFIQYEVSSFSKQGKQSCHNLMYWNYEDFCGIGLSASGKENEIRYKNTSNFITYFNEMFIEEKLYLSNQDQIFEHIMMSLRLKKGIDLNKIKSLYDFDFELEYKDVLQRQIQENLVVLDHGYLKTTSKGMLMLNDILVDYLEE